MGTSVDGVKHRTSFELGILKLCGVSVCEFGRGGGQATLYSRVQRLLCHGVD